jgi:hypothetical protein
MKPEQRAALKAHVREIAKILHQDATEKGMPVESLGEIEQTVRAQIQSHVSPELGLFLLMKALGPILEKPEDSPAS